MLEKYIGSRSDNIAWVNMAQRARVSVVIPTIEEESVFKLVKDLRSMLGRNTEIIIVDKSSDGYYRKLLGTGAMVIRQKDRGVENAIMLGLRKARGEYLASIDADGTHDIAGIRKGIEAMENGGADIILGNRLSGISDGAMGPYLQAGNSLLTWMFNAAYQARLHDVLTGLFVVRRNAFDKIRNVKPYRAGIAFFVIELAKRGCRVGEVNIKYYPRKYGESKLAKSKFAFGISVASHIFSK